jgi:putative transposase
MAWLSVACSTKPSPASLPVRLSFDHDPLYRFQRWQANLRILEGETVQTVPRVPRSHPFVERLIGSLRREYLDQLFFWNAADLERKLELFRRYFNETRVHQGLGADIPERESRRFNTATGQLRALRLAKSLSRLGSPPSSCVTRISPWTGEYSASANA